MDNYDKSFSLSDLLDKRAKDQMLSESSEEASMNYSALKLTLTPNLSGIRMKFSVRRVFFIGIVTLFIIFLAVAYGFYKQLPSINALGASTPVSSKILDRNGKLLYEIHGEAKRTPVGLEEISPHLIHATLVAEDKNFYKHNGIEPKALVRAFWKNAQAQTVVQGGSTITQQLVKNTLLNPERTYKRKLQEAVLAVLVEHRRTKNEILGLYLNQVPYGRNTYGAQAASLTYFGKPAKDLSLAESAYLASLPKAPSLFSPFGANRDALEQRKNHLLSAMLDQGYISQQEYEAAKQEQVIFHSVKTEMAAPHFVQWVLDELEKQYGRGFLEQSGLEIYTTLDYDLQLKAEQAVREGAEKNESRGASNAALVAIDPKTGQILAMVGSKDYFGQPEPAGCKPGVDCLFDPKTNIAVSERQPGSSFKPYTYVTAFSPEHKFTPSSLILDKTTNFAARGTTPYIPHNYDGKEHGQLTMRKALAGSLNIAAVRTLTMVGVNNVEDTAHKLGITSPLKGCNLSLTLGACEVKLLDHVSAYATLANGGKKNEVQSILKITNSYGMAIANSPQPAKQVIDPQAVYLVTSIMADAKARSFIFGSRPPLTLADRPVAAKTGTTQNFKDGWTLGFTPQLAAGVWVGNNNGALMKNKADGVVVAAPIWHKFMEMALQDKPVEDFPVPEGIVFKKVNPVTGRLANEHSLSAVTEVFASYSAPTKYDAPTPPPAPPLATDVPQSSPIFAAGQ